MTPKDLSELAFELELVLQKCRSALTVAEIEFMTEAISVLKDSQNSEKSSHDYLEVFSKAVVIIMKVLETFSE